MAAIDLDEAAKAALGVLHNVGSKAAYIGGEKLDARLKAKGFASNEVKKLTEQVGDIWRKGNMVPEGYKPEPLPEPLAWLGLLVPAAALVMVGAFVLGRGTGGRRG